MNHCTLPGMHQEKLHQSLEQRVRKRQHLHPPHARHGARDLRAKLWAWPGAGQDPACVTQVRVTGGALAARKRSRAWGEGLRGYVQGLHSTLFWGERRKTGYSAWSEDPEPWCRGGGSDTTVPGHPAAGHLHGCAAAAWAAYTYAPAPATPSTAPRKTQDSCPHPWSPNLPKTVQPSLWAKGAHCAARCRVICVRCKARTLPCVCTSVHRTALCARLQSGTQKRQGQEWEDELPSLPLPLGSLSLCMPGWLQAALPATRGPGGGQPPLSGSGTIWSGSNSPAVPEAAE